ncbi:putative glycosyl transferase [Tolypothrix sp. NIES-4075]|uniref:glycosyltransferase family 4 protein n=1 Tax=Tolypothrix sp. NIES-4075 TaxID=2005459 RepID=UPI000B6E217C|nr:glycosyltransferase family 4 protein [Tolypothrix sp. NIES-4075]GAX40649.1 putative glycosyl transferase [Tolypothrix sp. NIES-4075]
MTKYHIALNNRFDLEQMNRDAQADKSPSHVMWDISQLLKATVYQPGEEPLLPLDRIRACISSRPEHWALARKLSSILKEDDVIFCTGEDIGFAIASLCGDRLHSPKIVVFIRNINRPRSRLLLKLFQLADRVDLFLTDNPALANFLRDYLGVAPNRVRLFCEQPTDISFFTPGLASANKKRPIIASGGLEKRDYGTLAEATRSLDVDVNICAFSPNATTLSRTFPKAIPANMSYRYYDWYELRQLYRDADVVAITLFPNNYQAGLSTMFEAMACRRPVIITQTPGIINDIINYGSVIGVNPGDFVELKAAILSLINNPKKAETIAQQGYELVRNHYNHNTYIKALVTTLTSKYD